MEVAGLSFPERLFSSPNVSSLECGTSFSVCDTCDAAPVGARRHDAIGDEEPREARRGRKAEIEPDFRNRFRASGQSIDRALHAQGVEEDRRRQTHLLAKELEEMRARKAGAPRNLCKVDGFAEPLDRKSVV